MLFSFPGLTPDDDILSLLKFLNSKNPDNDIAAQIAINKKFDPCIDASTSKLLTKCDDGFVPDYVNGYCYRVHPIQKDLNEGDFECDFDYQAEMIQFETNGAVDGFISLLKSGKKLLLLTLVQS